jgi:hypothetical protein
MEKVVWLGTKIYDNNLPNFKTLEVPLSKSDIEKVLSFEVINLNKTLFDKLKNFQNDIFVWAGLQSCFKGITDFESASFQTQFKILIINYKKDICWLFDVLDKFEDDNRDLATLVNWGNGIMWKDVVFLTNKKEGFLNKEILSEIKTDQNYSSKPNPAFKLDNNNLKNKILYKMKWE